MHLVSPKDRAFQNTTANLLSTFWNQDFQIYLSLKGDPVLNLDITKRALKNDLSVPTDSENH